MICGRLGTRLFLAYVGARISCKASQDSTEEFKSYLNQLEMTDNQAISMDDLLYRTPIPTFHQSDQAKLTSRLQSNFESFQEPNNPWSSRQIGEIFAERNGSEHVTAGIKHEAWTFGVQPSQKDMHHPEVAVGSFGSHPGPGHETGVSWASIPTDPIRERPSRTQQYTEPPTNAHGAPPNLAVNVFQRFPENIRNAVFLSRPPIVSESHILRAQANPISGVVVEYPAFPQELLQSTLCQKEVGPISRDSRFNVVGEASHFETRINARSTSQSSNNLEIDVMDFLEVPSNMAENQSHGLQTEYLKRKPRKIRNKLQPSNDPHISNGMPLSPVPEPKETRAICHNISQDLSHIGINNLKSSEQSMHLSGGSNSANFQPNHTKEKSRKRTRRLKPSHDSKAFNSSNPTPGIDPAGNNVVEGESSRSNPVYSQRPDYNGLLENMHNQNHIETGPHSNKEIEQEITLNVNQNEIKFSDIFKFDVDVFLKENYETEQHKVRAESIISLIQKDKPQSSQICLSEAHPSDIWKIFRDASYQTRNKRKSIKGMTNESKIQHNKELENLRNNKQIDSINHLLSNRGYWHLFWTEKSNIKIFEAAAVADWKDLIFVRTVTTFMFYIHMISTILGDRFKSETNSNQNIFEDAHNFALEFAPTSYQKANSARSSLSLEDFKKMKISEIRHNQSKISGEKKIGSTSVHRIISSSWKWIEEFIKSLNNQYIIKIFSPGKYHFKMDPYARDFFNKIFFYSIEKLNQRLHKYYELKI